MLSFEPEILEGVSKGLLTERSARRLLPYERRETFSIYGELRLATWLAVSLLATGIGIFVTRNLRQTGPAVLITVLALASAACYAVILAKRHAPQRWPSSLLDDYILLLGALLLSANLGYAESQYHLLDAFWTEHFLLLAIIHGVSAYYFNSRTLLSLSLASLASWSGFRGDLGVGQGTALAGRALIASALTVLWRLGNRAFPARESFNPVFDHFIVLLSLFGALVWLFDPRFEFLGLLVVIGVSVASLAYAFKTGHEAFAVYAIAALFIAVTYELIHRIVGGNAALSLLALLLTSIAAVIALYQVHRRLKEER
ncbi:MAG TPA: DUF2157 domain-containing protein [Thermoanaerobaculia bacterium]|nr:DUF2157 domain-containing protein [Thermoanaerobaculia bacterium]